MKKWEQLEQFICDSLKVIDPTMQRTPGSGNGNKKGDVTCKTNIGLHIEAKQRELKNVWNRDWLKKCSEEIALHSLKIPVVVTQDKDENKVVHLLADDFFNLYIEFWKLKNGE